MYLFDTNIFLEILLSQDKSLDCKQHLVDKLGTIFISDFSLHSIGVILFKHKKENIFNSFISDVLTNIDIISISYQAYIDLSEFSKKFNMDFDDAYQCKIAEENNFTIITMDNDFKRVEDRIKIKFV